MNLSQQNFFYLVFSGRKTLKIRVILLSSLCCFLTDYRWLLIVSHWLWRSTTPHTHTHTLTDCGRVNCWWRGDREKMLSHGKTASNRGILQWTKLRLNDTRLQWIFKWKVNKKLKICTVVKKTPKQSQQRELSRCSLWLDERQMSRIYFHFITQVYRCCQQCLLQTTVVPLVKIIVLNNNYWHWLCRCSCCDWLTDWLCLCCC